MKIRPSGDQLFREDARPNRRTDRHDEANSRFSRFCERAKKSHETESDTEEAIFVNDFAFFRLDIRKCMFLGVPLHAII